MVSILPKPKLTSHPVDVGARHEAAILSELIRRGYAVLVPWGVNQRYDLVLDMNGKFVRAQCKTGRLRDGVIRFAACSTQANTRRGAIRKSYIGEIELFLVYCPDNGRIYSVPVDDCPANDGFLRVAPTENGQKRRIRWANDYELPE